jgi:hypothetical protein
MMMTRMTPAYVSWTLCTGKGVDELTFHQVVILRNLLWRTPSFDIRKQGHQDVLRKWPDVGLGESGESAKAHRLESLR